MIDRERLEELRKHYKDECDPDCGVDLDGPECPLSVYEMFDTIDKLLRVKEAANKALGSHVCQTYGCPNDGLDRTSPCDHNEKRDMKSLSNALAACEEEKTGHV